MDHALFPQRMPSECLNRSADTKPSSGVRSTCRPNHQADAETPQARIACRRIAPWRLTDG
jgi:hypothetical protein